jgi:hypothetical protein
MMDKFTGNFRRLDRVDVSEIKTKVLAVTDDDWEAYNFRQNRPKSAQAETQTIPLIFDEDFRHDDPTVHEKFFEFDCDTLLEPILQAVSDYYTGDGYVVRALLVRLQPQGVIPPHIDTGYSLLNCRRIHIPIHSTERVEFTVGGEQRAMKEGELWEINNAREHSVVNRGDQGRVHLIIDWVPI